MVCFAIMYKKMHMESDTIILQKEIIEHMEEVEMDKTKKYTWDLCSHELMADKKGKIYCRALNCVGTLERGNCEVCPLWDGLCGEIRCQYYDFVELEQERTPTEKKRYIEGLIQAGFTKEFPDFVCGSGKTNFASLLCLSDWDDDEWECVEKAYQFAAKAHKGMKRKGTDIPYFTHPMEVAYYAMLLSGKSEVVAAAVLHDVVEDTKYTSSDIERLFDEQIAELVAYESENKRDNMPKEESWRVRKEEFLEHLATAPISAKMIALADKLSNVKAIKKDWEEIGDDIWNRFNVKDSRQHAWYYLSVAELTKELSGHTLWQEYQETCEQLFLKDKI